ncbi:MAG: S-layer homology domain-containing protein [Bacillota bacterium]|nr:S-layer homology domain-containing protein [Bacillota bacterium]
MTQLLLASFLVLALLSTPWAGPEARAQAALPAPSAGAAAQLALARINGYRALEGLAPLQLSDSLGRAAQAHADYFLTNVGRFQGISLAVHEENPSWPGFTGVEPWDRAAAQGYPSQAVIGEDMAFGSGLLAGVDGLMATVYHRLLLLDPYAADLGVGLAGAQGQADVLPVLDLETGRRGSWPRLDPATAVLYPADGQGDVPVAFTGEIPDPLAPFGARAPAGYPITVQFPSLLLSSLDLQSASLVDRSTGGDVPFWALTPQSAAQAGQADELGLAVALLPRAPLAAGHRYEVSVDVLLRDVSGVEHRFQRTWSFTTQAPAYPPLQRLDARWALDQQGRISLVQLSLPAGVPGSAVRAFLAGLPVVQVQATASTFDFEAPAGVGAGPADLLVELQDGQGLSWPDFLRAGERVAPAPGAPPATVALDVDGAAAGQAQRLAGGVVRLPLDAVAAFAGWRLQRLPGSGEWWIRPGGTGGGYVAQEGRGFLWPVDRPVAPEPLPAPLLAAGGTVWLPLQPGSELAGRLLGESARLVVRGDGSVALDHFLYDISGNWAAPVIRQLAGQGVVTGYPDGSFQPQRPLSRGEALALVVRALGLKPAPLPGASASGDSWVAAGGLLGAAVAGGLLTPQEAASFQPAAPVERVELAVWLARAKALQRWQGSDASRLPYGDLAGLSAAERQAVAVVRAAGVMVGEPGGPAPRFAPGRPLSRAEGAVVAARLLDLVSR